MAAGLLLGSGGWIPTRRRETCCAYLRHGDRVLIIDAGTGVQRLVEDLDLLSGVERIDLVLTHFHLDHVAGLSYLPALELRPTIWGPGEALYGASTEALLDRLLDPPLFAARLHEIASAVHELPVGRTEVGGFELATRAQRRHTHPTLAIRVGDALTYCTDTAADPENVAFAGGSTLLLHEAWHADASTDDETHTAAGEAGRIAREAGVARLVLIHVNPLVSDDEALVRPARAEFGETSVGEDLDALEPLEL